MNTPDKTFYAVKRPGETLDFYIDCSTEFAKDSPVDQLSSVSFAVESGDVSVVSYRMDGTDMAIVRVSGGTKMYSWHGVRGTLTCASGQVYQPLIRIRLTR
jgi:hypothetical protein